MEDRAGGWTRSALQLRFYGPGEGGPVIFCQDGIRAEAVFVFGVEEKAVHVEEAGADWGEAVGGEGLVFVFHDCASDW